MGYVNTFITVAEDCPVDHGEVPQERGGKKTVAQIQYELLAGTPYGLTQEDVLFETYLRQKHPDLDELDPRRAQLRDEFFATPRACLRASPLPKRHGWGLHFDDHGRVALYPAESDEYRRLGAGAAGGPAVLRALRSSRR